MNIKLFLEISKEFFEIIYPPIVEDDIKEELYNDDNDFDIEFGACKLINDIFVFINPKSHIK